MSIWKRLFENTTKSLFDFGSKADSKSRDHIIDTDFAAAVVALAAKMAKADGSATHDETLAFKAAFPIAKEDEIAFDKLFALAKGSVLGFDGYAKQIGKRYKNQKQILLDVLAVLFFVAAADGIITKSEEEYLTKVAKYLGLSDADYSKISMPYFPDRTPNPYVVLGLEETATEKEVKQAWLNLVSANHPDHYLGRGEPLEFVKLANQRTAIANNAYAQIKAMRKIIESK